MRNDNLKKIIKEVSGQRIVNAIGDAVSIHDTAYRIVYQNDKANEVFGSHIGDHCYRVFENRKSKCRGCPMELSFKDGKARTVVKKISAMPGFVAEITVSCIKDAEGNVLAGIKVIRDISRRIRVEREFLKAREELELTVGLLQKEIAERREIEETLKRTQIRLTNIFNSLDEAVIVLTSDGIIKDVNAAAEKMFGYSGGQLAQHSAEVLNVDRKHYREFERIINRSFSRKQSASFKFKAKRKNGEVFPTEHTVSLLRKNTGEKMGIVNVIRDVSDRRKKEEKLKEAENTLMIRAKQLIESNTALKVLLKQREKDQVEFEGNILSNIKHLILPYIEKMKTNRSKSDDFAYLKILESNLKDITSAFVSKLSYQYKSFTPKELLVADLIRDGRQDKEIADILNISSNTIKFHRKNIRKKLGIYGNKTNLRTELLSLAK